MSTDERGTQEGSGESVECPTCDRAFSTLRGMKIHHSESHGESIAGSEQTCEICGESFRANRDRRFCSNKCYGTHRAEEYVGEKNHQWGGGPIEVECSECGETVTRTSSRVAEAKWHFCTRECEAIFKSRNAKRGEEHPDYRWHTVECAGCGEQLKRPNYEVVANEKFACSTECFRESRVGEGNPNWNGGTSTYGPGWNESKREAVRERDGRKCQNCNRPEAEHLEQFGMKHHVHHIQKARTFDDSEERNAVENLVTLCITKECHKKWEAMSPLRPDTGDR